VKYVESMFSLEGRVAVVTGGAGGLPSVMAAGLAKAGAKVCIWGRGTGHPIPDAVKAIKAKLPADAVLEGVTVIPGTGKRCRRRSRRPRSSSALPTSCSRRGR
jgi:NAD(P)-dependent dehydrogenase (short-subunit alcohol dehydrogenase family)